MKPRPMAGLTCLLPVLLVAMPPAPDPLPDDGLKISLLPRSLQKNPLLDQTVITEMTDDGRKLPPTSLANPAYYVAELAGRHTEGEGPEGSRLPTMEELRASLERALEVNGYLPAGPAQPPTLLIVCFWGAHTNLDAGSPDTDGSGRTDVAHENLLSRAALVGGTKFAEELRTALYKQDMENEAQRSRTDNEARLGLAPEIGSMLIDFGPLRRFTERDDKTRKLWKACGECYYVVASAYDYAAALRGHRRLLWRTKMTVEAESVSMRDTLPGLVANAGPYLGIDMGEAATLTRRMHRGTSVQFGPLEIIEYSDPPSAVPVNGAKP